MTEAAQYLERLARGTLDIGEPLPIERTVVICHSYSAIFCEQL